MSAPEQDKPGEVSLSKTSPPVPAAPSKLRAAVAKNAGRPLPTLRQIRVDTVWWAIHLAKLAMWSPVLLGREFKYLFVGIGRLATGWAKWCHVVEYAAEAKLGEGNVRAKGGESVENRKTGRRRLSLAALILFVGGFLYLWFVYQQWALLLIAVLVCVFDAVGRRGREIESVVPVALPAVLGASVPLSQITKAILETLAREGFEEGSYGVAVPLAYDIRREQYRISLSLRDQLKSDHLRAIERNIGARDFSILSFGSDTATVRELIIRVGDPLVSPTPRPFIPTGSVSILDGITLGVSMTEVPFKLPAAGVHWRVVAGTGGGKTKWFLRSVVDGLSACNDCVIGIVDITKGPEGTLWRDVLQYKGFDVKGAAEVLQKALDEIDRRSDILAEIAADDDPDNDVDEWHPGLGPYFVIVCDEFAQMAAYNGTGKYKDDPNLLAMAEQVVRTGRKHGVSLIMLTQKTGNDDFGSTTMSTQCGVSVAGPCDPDDSRRMFGLERRAAGYTPHLLAPGVEGEIRDAGKVYIESPLHRTPDVYRCFAPGTTAEVKRRARQRMEDGLPRLDAVQVQSEVLDAVEVPPLLAAVELVFRDQGNPERIPTATLLAELVVLGFDHTEHTLARDLRPVKLAPGDLRWRPNPKDNPVRGYYLADVEQAIRELS